MAPAMKAMKKAVGATGLTASAAFTKVAETAELKPKAVKVANYLELAATELKKNGKLGGVLNMKLKKKVFVKSNTKLSMDEWVDENLRSLSPETQRWVLTEQQRASSHASSQQGDPAVPDEQVVPLQGGQVVADAADAATGEVALLSQKRKKGARTPESKKRVFQSKIYNTCFQCYINALYQIRSFQAVPNDDCILPAEHMAAIKEVQEQRLRKVTARTSMEGKAHGARGRPGKIAKH